MRIPLTAALAATGLLMAAAGPARAAEPKPGSVHIGFALGNAHVAAVPSEVYDDLLLGLSLGYTVNRSFAVEVVDHRLAFGHLGAALSGIFGRPEPIEMPDRHLGVAAIGAVPLGESWRVLGRVGVGRTRVAIYGTPGGTYLRKEHRTDPAVGVGLAFDPSERWTLSLNATRLTKTKTSLATFELQFRF